MKLMQHQLDAVEKPSNGKILWGGVGTGKSITVLAYYMKKEAPRDIYIITTAMKRDSLEWQGDAAKFGLGKDSNATVAGTLHIDSWNNVARYTDIEDAFFIFDEQRLVGSGAWVKAFLKIAKKNHWLLLSGTPGDTWTDYAHVFIANGLYKNVSQFRDEHLVYAYATKYPKIIRYNGVATLEKYRNMLLVEVPYSMHTTRVVVNLELDHDITLMKKVTNDRWHVYEDRPLKDVGEMFRVMRKVVNSDPSRLAAVRELMEKHPRLIIFYNFNYELDILRTLVHEVPIAEWNGHRKQPIPDTDRWVYLVQYVSGAEGWNCISTDAMVFYSLTYSYKNFAQAQGRIDRLNTSYLTLFYYVLMSNSAIDRAVNNSLAKKELFNERSWALDNMLVGDKFDDDW